MYDLVPCFCFSYEIVFSNWLMMYLHVDDNECLKLIMKSFLWLKEGGYFLMRESYFHGCGTVLVVSDRRVKFCIWCN